ncbi:MAG: hypothetical protein A4E70_01987 [Syntrophus sp. PtaU1.Bin005]|jgi:hypothetical protein|nr:MAG: hypothetical protein A4E70_01987 [Syntrophus sp. PtaU1.Bin005]
MSQGKQSPAFSPNPSGAQERFLHDRVRILESLSIRRGEHLDVSLLPFAPGDTTAGSEAELQAVVIGDRNSVDLPLTIRQSNYFADMLRRSSTGDTRKRVLTEIEAFLTSNRDEVWENSWVHFPRRLLSPLSEEVLQRDLLADKEDPTQGNRTDVHKMLFRHKGQDYLRIPVSYLLKLSLAEVLYSSRLLLPGPILEYTRTLLGHFLNDNSSPETLSFYVLSARDQCPLGAAVAGEMAKRFLLTSLLILYANERFCLKQTGQQAVVYYSPHPPLRQKILNNCVSDAFYRELFMNPCLSGWRRGEEKQEYMHLCHQVLSRSQLNAIAKLREAGIITHNLVVLPNTSNISLSNNGTHVSLGSRRLGALLKDSSSGFTAIQEKVFGDLAVKIVEHFLPLFVGTYTAAPYRLDFAEFHPEKVLAFLPHELDYTHLRMLWRRWQKKAKLSVLGRPLTPFGPLWLDRAVSALCSLRGDFIPDFRMIDYLMALMSTERCPALDGRLHNSDRLKSDLTDLGVFDRKMSLYLFEKIREYGSMGFSGFESRHYSLFEQFSEDMGKAVDIQNLLYCLAFKYMAFGRISHGSIPDRPFVESERRQIIFGSAVGIPTFYIRKDTDNDLLRRILSRTERVRHSRRYTGYLRVYHLEYRRALVKILQEDAADLVDMFGMRETLRDLELRLEAPDVRSALGRLTSAILKEAGAVSPLHVSSEIFNLTAERYYRNGLRRRHIEEGLDLLLGDFERLCSGTGRMEQATRQALNMLVSRETPRGFIGRMRRSIFESSATPDELRTLIQLVLVSVYESSRINDLDKDKNSRRMNYVASVC